jgi:hypothetical protein
MAFVQGGKTRRGTSALRARCILALASLVLPAALAASTPRPISPAERAAVRLAADYLTLGVERWEAAVAEESFLASLPPFERRAEIEVRLGPPEGAEWSLATPSGAAGPGAAAFSILYPSGLEEFLELELVEDGERWKLARISSSVDPRPEPVDFGELFNSENLAKPLSDSPPPWLWAAAALFLVPLSYRYVGLRWRVLRRWALVAPGLAMIVWSCGGGSEQGADATLDGQHPGETRLGELRELRWRSAGAAEGDAAVEEPSAGPLLDVAHIWEAEELLLGSKLTAAEELLQSVPTDARYPRAELLRARVALLHDEAEAALEGYKRAQQLFGSFFVVEWEMVEALIQFGEHGSARAKIGYLAEAGSRRSDVHYISAFLQLSDGLEDEADETFQRAWALDPQGREEIFTNPILATFAARPAVLPLLDLGSHEEPEVEAEDAGFDPLEVSPEVEGSLYGRRLVMRAGDSALEVPNGAPLAPAGTRVGQAGGRRREDELAALEWLAGQDLANLSAAGPIARKRAELAASALKKRERWAELLDLTDSLLEGDEEPSAELEWFRISAARGLDRREEAKALLVALAKRGIAEKNRDPVVLIELAELFAETEDFKTAIRLLERASALGSTMALDSRIRQFALDEALAKAYSGLTTDHFEIRFPRESGNKYAFEVAYVLEQERIRLQRWIPAHGDGVIEVHLFPLMQFMNTFSNGLPVAGLFDGKVRVPLADLRSLHPSLVATLSHELAHAMIDRKSAGRAPKWFHEGLAQHIQMADQRLNYLTELRSASRAVALPVLEPILRGFSEPQFVEMAYGQAAWLAHYLEERSGRRVFARLMDAFARGLDSEAAIVEAVGVSFVDFENAFWEWATATAPKAWPTEPRRYDKEVAVAEFAGFHPGVDRPETPAVGTTGPRAPTPQESRAKKMTQWHARYSKQAIGVKRSLGEVLGILKGRSDGNLQTACRGLAQSLDVILGSRGALDSPDPAVNASLRQAFSNFQGAAVACQSGSVSTLRRGIERGENRLSSAARALAPFGLKP